jgi:hypothetical protein
LSNAFDLVDPAVSVRFALHELLGLETLYLKEKRARFVAVVIGVDHPRFDLLCVVAGCHAVLFEPVDGQHFGFDSGLSANQFQNAAALV